MSELSDDALTGSFRVFQRVKGHRYSLDDVLTAWEAAQVGAGATRHVDLGCGIGSVLLMVAYKLPHVRSVGIEAQEMSVELARRNVERNVRDERVSVRLGDLRDESWEGELGRFDLVTGTPPYMPLGTSTPSPDPQRRFARVEMRGGVEDYLRAAARLVENDGHVVVCGDARSPERVEAAAEETGLSILCRRDAIPRKGKAALFSVWTLTPGRSTGPVSVESFVARTAAGERTDAYRAVRAFFDLRAAA